MNLTNVWSELLLFLITYLTLIVILLKINNLKYSNNLLIWNFKFNWVYNLLITLSLLIINLIYIQLNSYTYYIIEYTCDVPLTDFENSNAISSIQFLPNPFDILLTKLNPSTLNFLNFPFLFVFILITFISIISCLTYNKNELSMFTIYLLLITLFGIGFFLSDSMLIFFIFYELLLLPSFLILYKFAKTRKTIEASFLMFFWTQFGALFLIFSLLYIFILSNTLSFTSITNNVILSKFEINFLVTLWVIGFGVKLPIWPFYGWLPKAHVEASTNFSIFLSGVLVKFAFFGFLKCLYLLKFEITSTWLIPYLIIGLTDSTFKLYYQIDLKKLVAYSTVVEMHWLMLCTVSGHTVLNLSAVAMFISHALLSSNSFLMVDSIVRRFKTRLITEIHGINFLTPKLFLVILINLVIFLGFPGSLFFIAEFLFFTFLMDFSPLLGVYLFLLVYLLLPIFFLRSWMNVLFSYSKYFYKTLPVDLDKFELTTYSLLTVLLVILGLTFTTIII